MKSEMMMTGEGGVGGCISSGRMSTSRFVPQQFVVNN